MWKESLPESEKYMKYEKSSQQELTLVLKKQVIHSILEAEFLE